jgi:hypothetical protein
MLCLPWGSSRVSNNCLKLEQAFESGQDEGVKNLELWQKVLHATCVKSGMANRPLGRAETVGRRLPGAPTPDRGPWPRAK